MQYCTACNKSIATIHILDLKDGSISDEKHLCSSCADQSGLVQVQKAPPIALGSAEMLDLIGTIKTPESDPDRPRGTACPACGLTAAEFKVRGRLGCPRCYDVFRSALITVLERVHDETCHRGRAPGQGSSPPTASDILADLRQKLADAVGRENYEEAASLRDQIRQQEETKDAS